MSRKWNWPEAKPNPEVHRLERDYGMPRPVAATVAAGQSIRLPENRKDTRRTSGAQSIDARTGKGIE